MTIDSHDLGTQQSAKGIATRLETTPEQLREWHKRRAKDLTQEQERYIQNPKTYKSLNPVNKVPRETGQPGIKAVRLRDSAVTNNPNVVMEEVLTSFKREDNTKDG